MLICRMGTDGANPKPLTSDENSNGFAHSSPDNNWIDYITYTTDEQQAYLVGKQGTRRLMNLRI
ncbi:hypothetical protein [Spirosoma jeollabukense]